MKDGGVARMIQLTRLDGEALLVNPRYIVIVYPSDDTDGNTLLIGVAQPSTITVKEAVAEIHARCDGWAG